MSQIPSPSISSMLIKQRERWQRGDCVLVEKLIAEQPTISAQAEPVLELLYQEMLLSEENGQTPQLDDYLQRFPQFAEQLRMQFEIHAALSAADAADGFDDVAGRGSVAFSKSAARISPRCPEIYGYELLSELGRGGMGIVYKARQIKLNRIVALKMIRAGLLAGSQELARFRHEAEVVAQLQHPHIVQIHEVGETHGWPYLALEFVDGTSLDKALGGKPQPVKAAARLLETLARTIHYAHLRGVVHRDLKPANVLLGSVTANRELSGKTPSFGPKGQLTPAQEDAVAPKSPSSGARTLGQTKRVSSPTVAASPLDADLVKITDFGLAKNVELGTAGPTHTGDLLGTPSYMAPEQAGGKPGEVGYAADIYSLGAILYEMLTGRPPFVADTIVETLLLVRTQEPSSPSRLRPDLPRDLVTISLTCLQKQPWRRYTTALDLADDLRHYLENEPIRARPVGFIERSVKWARRRPTTATLIGTVLFVIVFGFLFVSWQLKQTAAALSAARKAHAETRAQNYLNSVALAHHELLAHHVTQAERLLEECPATQRGWEWYYLQRLCQTDLLTMSGHISEVRALAYSKDGRFIASGTGNWYYGLNDGEAKIWDARTGKELHALLHNSDTVFAVTFSPDSKFVATGGRMEKIKLWNTENGEPVREFVGNHGSISDLAFSPDGKQLVSTGIDVRLWDVETGEILATWKKHTSAIFSTAWSPDGRFIATTDWKGEINLWDANRRQHIRQLADVIDLRACSFSPDSSLLAAGSWDGTIWIWDLKNLDAPPSARQTNSGQIYDLAFAPDGRRLAYCARDCVKLWDFKTGGELHDFAGHEGVAPSLAFSPDGTRLATGGVDGSIKIWDATIRDDFRRYVEPNSVMRGFVEGSEGRLFAVGSANNVVRMWDTATSAVIHSIPYKSLPGTAAAADRNGRWLAWIGTNNTLCVWERTTEMMSWTHPLISGPISGLAFSPNGRQFAWGGADGIVRIHDVESPEPRATLGEAGRHVTGIAYHPHGKLLATIDEEGIFRIWDLAARKIVAHFGGSRRTVSADGSYQDSQNQSTPRMARLAYSPDGRRLVSATRLRPLEIWDTESGRLALVLDRVVDGADCAAFTPDGRQLYSGLGALIRFWDTADQDRHERLRMADEHAVAWHRRWYPICQKEENWAGTALHLNYLIKTNPTEGLYREQLADAIGNLGLWDQAWSENELAIELGRRNGLTFYDRACFALRSGDLPTYRQTCLDALDLIPANADAAKANTLSWISLMHPSAPGDPLRLVELAESAVKKQPKSSVYRNTLGAALYRAGLYNDAIVQLHAAIDAQDRKLGTSFDWVFLAMAYAKTGDRTKAQYWLDKVVAAPDANDWQTQLEVRLLRAEAADAIHTMSPSAQATDSL